MSEHRGHLLPDAEDFSCRAASPLYGCTLAAGNAFTAGQDRYVLASHVGL